MLGAHAVAYHDGNRCGKTQGAGAADDENGNASCQGETDGLSGQQPHDGGNDGNGNYGRNENARYPVSHFGDGGLWWQRRR